MEWYSNMITWDDVCIYGMNWKCVEENEMGDNDTKCTKRVGTESNGTGIDGMYTMGWDGGDAGTGHKMGYNNIEQAPMP